MSDQDSPPPIDPSSGNDAPPPPPSSEGQGFGGLPTAAPPVGGVALGQGKLPESDERTMGMLAHILGGITSFLGPLIIWLIKKDESPFVNDQGKEALNFQITVTIGYVAAIIIGMIPWVGCVSAILLPALGIGNLVFAILGGLEANKGKVHRYPFALRLIS